MPCGFYKYNKNKKIFFPGFLEGDHAVVDADGIKFRCPADALYTFGDHARYPYPGKCRYYIICWKNGKTTVNGCPENTAYNPMSFTCEKYASPNKQCP